MTVDHTEEDGREELGTRTIAPADSRLNGGGTVGESMRALLRADDDNKKACVVTASRRGKLLLFANRPSRAKCWRHAINWVV